MRRRRWAKIFVGLIVLGTGAAVLAYLIVLPWIVRREVLGALRSAGWERASFRVTAASLWHADVRDVVTEAGSAAKVEHISIAYHPRGILRGELESITLRGAELAVAWPGVATNAGTTKPATTTTTTAPATTRQAAPRARDVAPSAAPLFDLPVGTIELVDSALVADTPNGPVRIPVDGTLVTPPGQAYRVDLRLRPRGETLHLVASVDPKDGRTEATARSEALDLATVIAAARNLAGDIAIPDAAGTIDLDASFRWTAGQANLLVRASPDDVEITIPSENPGQRRADKLRWSWGVLEVEAAWAPDQTGLIGAIRVDGVDAELAGASPVLIEGASGAVAWSALSPSVETLLRQTIAVDRLEAGGMVLTDGTLEFDAADGLLHVHQTRWNWAGGVIAAEDFSVDPATPATSFVLTARDIELRRLLELLADEYASGSGQIGATLPITVEGSRLTFGAGRVHTVGGGQIRIFRAREIAEQVAAAQNDSTKAQVQQNIAAALADFEYQTLDAELVETPDRGLMARVHLAGRGRSGVRQPLDLRLNIDGLDDLLRSYMGLQRAMDRKR